MDSGVALAVLAVARWFSTQNDWGDSAPPDLGGSRHDSTPHGNHGIDIKQADFLGEPGPNGTPSLVAVTAERKRDDAGGVCPSPGRAGWRHHFGLC